MMCVKKSGWVWVMGCAALGAAAGLTMARGAATQAPATSGAATQAAADAMPPFLPAAPATGPALCQSNFLKPEQGKAALDFTLATYPTLEAWKAHVAHLRVCIQRGAGLEPLPKRTPLNAVVRDKRAHEGYTVESVALETVPGYWACGTLYRPLNFKAGEKVPAVLNVHGHGDQTTGGRFATEVQQRAATLARMGAVVLSMEMFAYGDSVQQVPATAHRTDLAMTIQAWDNMRALDFLEGLAEVDGKKLAVTGESGGGTQSFILTALDERICLNVPVVMVSSYFFGGCPCESGRPIHRDAEHFCTNAEIASLCAPRPMLVVSDGADWTQNVPVTEFPFLRKIYGLFGKPSLVENVHLADEKHDYGPSKRLAMYQFLARQFNLDLKAATNVEGKLDESKVTVETPAAMHTWTTDHPLPKNALHGVEAIRAALQGLQK
jgi:hypothetical protein